MTVQEFYLEIKGNYEEIIGRMRDDARVKKFVFMFLRDETYDRLCETMDAGNYEEAFRHAHTLKGLCQNLAFSDLSGPVHELTECLRGGICDDRTLTYFAQTKEKFEFVKKAIEELQNAE